jgi:hypothetical protein
MRTSFRLPMVAVGSLLVLTAGCRRNQNTEPPVATPSLSFSKDRVPIGSAVTLTYKFQVAPNASIDKNYYVFVHVLDPEGEQMWDDDHLPSVPTSQWKPGQTIEYSRTIFVPNYPYIGEAIVRLGLYDPTSGNRLTLNAQDLSRREYLVTKFQLLPSSENIFLVTKSGWQSAEVDAKNPANEWQWTKKTATLSFRNPKKDSAFYLDFDARPDLFNPPQHVTVKIDDKVITDFAADAKERTIRIFPISADQLGAADMVDLVFDVDKTFTPGAGDPRELGIRVYHTYLGSK